MQIIRQRKQQPLPMLQATGNATRKQQRYRSTLKARMIRVIRGTLQMLAMQQCQGVFHVRNQNFIIEASGSDIWNNGDGFHFAYQYVSGNCEMVTKVESLEGTNEWAKAGLMIRETLDGGSKMTYACVTNRSGITWHQRQETNAAVNGGDPEPNISAPYWLKINRTGDTFSFYKSADGKSWQLMGNTNVSMAKNVYIGFAVTSHDNNELCKAVFTNSKLTAKTAKFEL